MDSAFSEAPLDGSSLARWRLILGRQSEAVDSRLSLDADQPDALALRRREDLDRAMAFVYSPAGATGGRADLSRPAPYLPQWLDLVREQFSPDVVRVLFRDALESRGLSQLLLEPEALAVLEPDPQLVAALLSMRDLVPDRARECIRDLVSRLVKRLVAQIRQDLVTAVRNGPRRSPIRYGSYRSLDWPRTLRANLRHYDASSSRLVPREFHFRGGERAAGQWHIVLLVDQSGSMGESVVHATVVASVLASVRSIDVRMILFGTEVADVSAIATAPVDILLGAQIGGGTDIAGAVEYAAANLIRHPSRTLLVVVTDLYEGGDEDALVSRLGALNTSRCRTACVLGVSVSGRADFNERLAARLAAVGTPSFAASPDRLVDLISKLWDPMWPPAGL